MQPEIYKGHKIIKNDFKYYEAVNIKDCDAKVLVNKNLQKLKIDIDEQLND